MEYTTDEIVILVDVAYLDREVGNLSAFFSAEVLKRPLPKADVALFLTAICLDAGVSPANHKMQVIFVYDKNNPEMKYLSPSDLKSDLHNMAFNNEIGEFSMAAYHNEEDLITPEALYREMMKILAVSKGTTKVLLVTDISIYEKEDWLPLDGAKDREVYFYTMNPADAEKYPFIHKQLGFSVLNALHVRSDEFSDN